jgi:hypothetical protein
MGQASSPVGSHDDDIYPLFLSHSADLRGGIAPHRELFCSHSSADSGYSKLLLRFRLNFLFKLFPRHPQRRGPGVRKFRHDMEE